MVCINKLMSLDRRSHLKSYFFALHAMKMIFDDLYFLRLLYLDSITYNFIFDIFVFLRSENYKFVEPAKNTKTSYTHSRRV